MGTKQNFAELKEILLPQARALLETWLPEGRLWGQEFVCGSLKGEAGRSCKINLRTGRWSDFATGERGGDLISLYAAITGVSQIEALWRLANNHGRNNPPRGNPSRSHISPVAIKNEKPPRKAPIPRFHHPLLGKASASFAYKNLAGELLYYVCRFERNGKKEMRPLTFSDGEWKWKGWAGLRPIYNQENFQIHLPFLVVEGEKAASAGIKVLGDRYNVTTWHGGVNAWMKHDWSPLKSNKVILWPDDDDPGRKCMRELSFYLTSTGAQVTTVKNEGNSAEDIADLETQAQLIEERLSSAQMTIDVLPLNPPSPYE